MPKLKSHKGTLKRMKVTARGKVTFRKAGKSHLNSGLTGNKSRSLRQDSTVKKGDIKRLERVLHRPLIPRGR